MLFYSSLFYSSLFYSILFKGLRLTAGRRPKGKGRGSRFAYVGPMLGYVSPMLAPTLPTLALSWSHVSLCWPYLGPMFALSCPYVGPGRPYIGPMLPHHVDKFCRSTLKHFNIGCFPSRAPGPQNHVKTYGFLIVPRQKSSRPKGPKHRKTKCF